MQNKKYCVVVPAYMEQRMIGEVVSCIKKYAETVVVIDDGSPDRTAAEAEKAGAIVVRHEHNKGKGAALATGFRYALEQGFDFLITMDGDGQHDPSDIPGFVRIYLETGVPVLIGNRMNNTTTMPLVRKLTNMFISWRLSRETGRFIPDTQCGYRLFQCDIIPVDDIVSRRYDAESEILLYLADRGIRMDSVPVATIYGAEKSKINPVRDTWRFFALLRKHRRLSAAKNKKEC